VTGSGWRWPRRAARLALPAGADRYAPGRMAPDPHLARFLDAERDALLTLLTEWVSIPSVSADPLHAADVRRSADWCAGRMRTVGLENVAVLETPGHPAVYGDHLHASGAPTVLVYGHHDVQPVDPVEAWTSPPFQVSFRGGDVFGRGAADDKGQVLYHLEAVRGLLAADGRLPVNLKVLVEGEEESGSPNFEALLRRERDRLSCDVVVVSDTAMLSADTPSLCTGMRGLAAFDVRLRSADHDLHSGSFGGAVLNAAHVAARLVAALHDDHGRVTLPGFYDTVVAPTDAERALLSAVPFDEAGFGRDAAGAPLAGEEGFSTRDRIWTRPTCDVTGLTSGYAGEGAKTIVPSEARMKVTFRLVPDQDPADVTEQFEAWLSDRVPGGVDVECHREGDGVRPVVTAWDHPALRAAARVVGRVWGHDAVPTREGGSGPEEALARVLSAPLVFLGVGLPDDRIHAPDEKLSWEQFERGLLAVGELWFELAALPAAGWAAPGSEAAVP